MSSHSPALSQAWLGCLHALALADGDFSPQEQQLLADQLREELPGLSLEDLVAPDDAALKQAFGGDGEEAEQFLRSATVVALADGHISEPELALLQHWSEVLGVGGHVLDHLEACGPHTHAQPLDRLRHWLDDFQPTNPQMARFLVKMIPSQCPFERDITLFGHKLVHIPPMCKINPLYDQLVGLRFRALERLEQDGSEGSGAMDAR
ncbi:Mo-dependent nitrogenase [Synechococcus sp. RSCCF101]|uniref:Mo-dependent nitrogenase C-terminal domain-containing protein n=1 Tax=Synechococcus sp. RSCCF101 TaxID=2511069 RepID=UPI0012467764|nr:Mo-dependent nitrogenase C-terminal domain-containing protein [Synechococcus sp. RSCCF101]QEY31744.1 Mo-dependent nitrogenase [Synechococcus sp. RSCCF101]